MTEAQALLYVRNWCAEFDTQKLAAERLGVSKQYLSDILSGRRTLSHDFCDRIGLVRVNCYRLREKSQ